MPCVELGLIVTSAATRSWIVWEWLWTGPRTYQLRLVSTTFWARVNS